MSKPNILFIFADQMRGDSLGCLPGSPVITPNLDRLASEGIAETDKLRRYGVAHRELIPETVHSTEQYENNRAEQSHEATRVRERGMRKFKSTTQAQRFVTAHAAVQNLFNIGRHLVKAEHYRNLRISAFSEWRRAVA